MSVNRSLLQKRNNMRTHASSVVRPIRCAWWRCCNKRAATRSPKKPQINGANADRINEYCFPFDLALLAGYRHVARKTESTLLSKQIWVVKYLRVAARHARFTAFF